MSYCRCENTLLALQEVLNDMQEEGGEFLANLSREEKRAYQELFMACEDFIKVAEDLDELDRETA